MKPINIKYSDIFVHMEEKNFIRFEKFMRYSLMVILEGIDYDIFEHYVLNPTWMKISPLPL